MGEVTERNFLYTDGAQCRARVRARVRDEQCRFPDLTQLSGHEEWHDALKFNKNRCKVETTTYAVAEKKRILMTALTGDTNLHHNSPRLDLFLNTLAEHVHKSLEKNQKYHKKFHCIVSTGCVALTIPDTNSRVR